MIQFKKIRLKNYKNIGGAWVELDFDKTGFYRISGTNGTGKTTILSALTFALFGKNSDMRNDSKSPISSVELINDLNKKELVVELFLENGMLIRRGLKPDIFEIVDIDGMNLADKSSKTIDQNFLEQEILGGITFSMFHKLTYVSSKAISTPFLYMTPSQRKEFLEHVLDIRLIYYVGEEIKKRASEKKLDLKTVESQMTTLKMSLQAEESNLSNLEIQKKEQDEQIQLLVANKSNMIKEVESQMAIALEEYKTEFNYKAELATKLSDLLNTETTLKADVSLLESFYTAKFQVSRDVSDIQTNMIRLKNEKDLYDTNMKGFVTCGTCENLKNITQTFDLTSYNKKIEELKKSYSSQNDQLVSLTEKLKDKDTKQSEYSKVCSDIAELNIKISESNQKLISKQDTMTSLKKRVEELNGDMSQVKTLVISYENRDNLKKQVETIETSFDNNKSILDQLERIKSRISDKTLHRQVMEQYVPIFQAKVNELLSKFMEDDPFSFSLEFDESFNITGKKNGKESNIFKLSEGQKTSIHFSILFAMQYIIGLKNANSDSVLMIDEILDLSLDASRVDKVVQYLKELSGDRLIILISHNDDIEQEYFDKIINVTKVHNFSHYEIH